MMVAAPLLLLADPLPVLLRGLPLNLRYRLGRLLTRAALVRRALKAMTWMGFTIPVYLAVVWGWHYPAAFEAALRNYLIHDLQHFSFFIAAFFSGGPSSTRLREFMVTSSQF